MFGATGLFYADYERDYSTVGKDLTDDDGARLYTDDGKLLYED